MHLVLTMAAALPASIDLAALVNSVVIPLLEPVLIAVAIWALTKLGALWHITISDKNRALVEGAIANGIAFAQSHVAAGETVSVDAKVAKVVDYVLPKIPGALTGLGITPDHLAELVEARLPAAVPAAPPPAS